MARTPKKVNETRTFGPRNNLLKIGIMAGAIVAFTIGAGFATGQEIMQYFASYGFWGIFGGFAVVFVILWVSYVFIARVGYEQNFEKPTNLFYFLGGRYLGIAMDIFFVLQMFLLFTMMVAGGGSLFKQHYGTSVFVGGITVSILVTATAWFGLRGLIEIIGRIGPIIVLIVVVLGVTGLVNASDGLLEGNRIVAELDIIQPSSHWFPAAATYSGVVILMLAPFVSTLGRGSDSVKQAEAGGFAGALSFTIGGVIAAIGLLANIGRIYDKDIPLMVLAEDLSPVVASLVSVVILAGIYTTAVPLLWSVSSRFYKDKTTEFKIVTVVTALVGSIVGLAVPFPQLLNFTFQLSGYVGILVFVLVVVHLVFFRGKRREINVEKRSESMVMTDKADAKRPARVKRS